MRKRNDSDGLKGDRALRRGDHDRLGFRQVAARIASALAHHSSNDGLVIGLDGQWGSGKSSLLQLIQEELEQISGPLPTVINFRPWLVGSRDALLSGLFSEFAVGINQYRFSQGDSGALRATEAKKVAENMRRFGEALSKFGGLVELVGEASSIKPVAWIGKVLSKSSDPLKSVDQAPSLVDRKAELSESLRALGQRFVVTVDDVDRLEPSEIVELMRLVRSVADFPNVIYLLCYDSEILKHSIEAVTKAKDGDAFLEKIVQLTVMVPRPEPFELRQWFTEELRRIAELKDADEIDRLTSVIDREGGRQLKTPRAVVRTLDSIRFFWASLKDDSVDFADLVWLMLIKGGNPALYRWIEKYCATAALLAIGTARVDDAERKATLKELISILDDDLISDPVSRHEFAQQLPGVEVRYKKDAEPFEVYKTIQQDILHAAIAKRRLKSPDHYRHYFALTGPSYALTYADFEEFWGALNEGAGRTGGLLLNWDANMVAGSLSKAEMLLERLLCADALNARFSVCLLTAMADCLDDAYRQRRPDDFWYNSLWRRAEKVVPKLLQLVESEERVGVVDGMFSNGRAIGWLTSLFRHEVFAHGRYGTQQRPEEDWLLSSDELDRVTVTMLGRYRSLTLDQLATTPSPLDILFAWRQAGDEDGPRALVNARIEDKVVAVQVAQSLLSAAHSSDRGRYEKLSRDNIERFTDYDGLRAKIELVAADSEHPELMERAKALKRAFENACRD